MRQSAVLRPTAPRTRTHTSAHLYSFASASFPAEWFPKLADALLGKSEVSPLRELALCWLACIVHSDLMILFVS